MKREKIKQKSESNVITINSGPYHYSQSLVLSLIEYARNNQEFTYLLKNRTVKLPRVIDTDNYNNNYNHIKLLLPLDYETAVKRLDWLVAGITEDRLPGARTAAGILRDWVGDKELVSPKQIVIGITVGRIPGVTLGRIVKKVSMAMVIRKDLASKIDLKITSKITEASHRVMASAFETAGGDIRKLEPDLADWFFGEKELNFFSADGDTIKKINSELKHLGIANALVEVNGEEGILAVSPALNISYGETVWGLKRI